VPIFLVLSKAVSLQSDHYTYDANSNRTGFTAPDGSTNTYTYDTLNRLSTLANSWAGSFGFTGVYPERSHGGGALSTSDAISKPDVVV
jgi:YD repeat-containing protein